MSLIRRALDGRLLYVQVLFVFIAFGVMVFSSYIHVRNIEREHLERESEALFAHIESLLSNDLQEFETMLGIISETVQIMILQDETFEEIKAYMTQITDYGLQQSGIEGFISVFGFFDVFEMMGSTALCPI